MEFGIVPVAAITVICYLVSEIVKATDTDNKWIPVICGIVGGTFGIASYASGMEAFPAQDPITAIAVGIVSGLAATGTHQIIKQLWKE